MTLHRVVNLRLIVSMAIAALTAGALLFVVGAANANSHCDAIVSEGESIQDALDNADEGDTICVEAGTFDDELLVISTDDLTLQGAGIGQSIIDGPADPQPQGTIDIDADGVTVDGFTVLKQDINQNREVIGILNGSTGTILQNLDVSAPNYNVAQLGQPIIGNVGFSNPSGDVSLDNVTTDRASGSGG
jgi:hypothetical protein